MPQGGIDPGENPRDTAVRELAEETGIAAHLVRFVAEAPEELVYDLPPELIGKIWKGRYRGQRQRWFLFRFHGEDRDIDIQTDHPEFRAWRWADPRDLPAMIVPFKRALYAHVLAAFEQHLSPVTP